MIPRYYERELRYLYEAGKEFGEQHPEQAGYLRIDSESNKDRDPYVERLFEGFAFLAGRIHERLDDELPQYTEALFSLLWPHFLKPIPALAILEFKPKPGLVQQTLPIKMGTEARSREFGEEGVVCRFRTTQEVRLQPLQLKEARIHRPPDGTSFVNLQFVLGKGIEYSKLQLSPLSLFFHASDVAAATMHLFFTRYVTKVVVQAGDARMELGGQELVQPGGLSPQEGVVDYSPHSFTGYRLLQEYFSFRPKFWFADLHGLGRFEPPPKTSEFQIQILFGEVYPVEKEFKTENVRLFCTPIVNLFRKPAEPIRIDHLTSEYRVVADARYPRSVEVYSINSVEGSEEGTGTRHQYQPFFSYQHDATAGGRYFTTMTRFGPAGQYEMHLTPGGFQSDQGVLKQETLSLEITCTNGNAPRELPVKAISQPAPDFTSVATFENLTQPTLALPPPHWQAMRSAEKHEKLAFLWKLTSHLALNNVSVASLEALRSLLELYDWTIDSANRSRINGVRSVSWAPKELLYRGAIIRGAEVTLEVELDHFAGEGDLCLFGLVLSEFFSMYATINSFVHTTFIAQPTERRYHWRPQRGNLPVI